MILAYAYLSLVMIAVNAVVLYNEAIKTNGFILKGSRCIDTYCGEDFSGYDEIL